MGAVVNNWLSLLIGGGLIGGTWKAAGAVRDFRVALQELRAGLQLLTEKVTSHENRLNHLDGGGTDVHTGA